jgi:hypothetical protein
MFMFMFMVHDISLTIILGMKVLELRKLTKKIEGLKIAVKMKAGHDLYLSGECDREQYETDRATYLEALVAIGEAGKKYPSLCM